MVKEEEMAQAKVRWQDEAWHLFIGDLSVRLVTGNRPFLGL